MFNLRWKKFYYDVFIFSGCCFIYFILCVGFSIYYRGVFNSVI